MGWREKTGWGEICDIRCCVGNRRMGGGNRRECGRGQGSGERGGEANRFVGKGAGKERTGDLPRELPQIAGRIVNRGGDGKSRAKAVSDGVRRVVNNPGEQVGKQVGKQSCYRETQLVPIFPPPSSFPPRRSANPFPSVTRPCQAPLPPDFPPTPIPPPPGRFSIPRRSMPPTASNAPGGGALLPASTT